MRSVQGLNGYCVLSMAVTHALCGAPNADAALPTPEIAITPAQARALFGNLQAKMIIHYAPGSDGESGRESPLFLLDFAKEPYAFQLVCQDAMSWHGDPFISPDGTRIAYNNAGKIYVRRLEAGGPGKTLVGEGYKQRWWFHPKTGDEYVIFTTRKFNNNSDFSGTTYIRGLRKGTCEPEGPVKVLVEKYALGEGRSPDGRYICGTQPGCAIVELQPDAVENAFVRVVWSQRRKCNGSMVQHPALSGKFCWTDDQHNRMIFGPNGGHDDILPPAPHKKVQWSEWSTHPDYLSASPSRPNDWQLPDVHDVCIYQVSRATWVTVTHKGRDSHLWAGKPAPRPSAGKPPASAAAAQPSRGGRKTPAAGTVARWDARLTAQIRAALARGEGIVYSSKRMRGSLKVTSVSEDGALWVSMPGMQVRMAIGRLTLAERMELALASLTTHDAESHAVAAFYLLATGNDGDAERHLARAGDKADEVRAAFE